MKSFTATNWNRVKLSLRATAPPLGGSQVVEHDDTNNEKPSKSMEVLYSSQLESSKTFFKGKSSPLRGLPGDDTKCRKAIEIYENPS